MECKARLRGLWRIIYSKTIISVYAVWTLSLYDDVTRSLKKTAPLEDSRDAAAPRSGGRVQDELLCRCRCAVRQCSRATVGGARAGACASMVVSACNHFITTLCRSALVCDPKDCRSESVQPDRQVQTPECASRSTTRLPAPG